jgi:nicotinate-nucleotide pyrophosphorylase (carboxylating)
VTHSNDSLTDSINTLVSLALAEDLGARGDVTGQATLAADAVIHGRITAKAAGVIAGLALVEAVYARLDASVVVQRLVTEGARVEPGTPVCDVTGNARAVLAGERTALNFLQRLSGIATLTAQFVDMVAGTGCTILDTRKTTPGWRVLEKYAVRMGGGHNHRIGLYDMILIKDNHIDAAGGITAAVRQALDYLGADRLPIVIEVKDMAELREALALAAQTDAIQRILLDNLDDAGLREAVSITAGRVPLEASGNMRLDRVRSVAETGVDTISVGALTHSAPALDLSMRLAPPA